MRQISELMTNHKKHPVEQSPLFKLLIITQFFPPDYAATGQLINELALRLAKLKMRVQIFTGQPCYAFDRADAPVMEIQEDQVLIRRSRTTRVWSHRIRGKVIRGLLFCIRSFWYLFFLNNDAPDMLLLTTEPAYLPLIGYMIHLVYKTPYICLIYDLYPDVAIKLSIVNHKHWIVKFWNWANYKIWNNAAGIIVLSSTMKDIIIKKYPNLRDKITIISNWADPNEIKPLPKTQNQFAREYDLVDKFTVLYSGNMGRCHDADTILAVIEELSSQPIQFVFIGGGAKRKQLQQMVINLNLTKNCLFLPYQDKSMLPYSLTACDLALVSIELGMEGLIAPSKLYGILAAGRPVAAICEPHSYLRDLLAEANCGQAFDNGDAKGLANYIRYLANDAEMVNKLGNNGNQYLLNSATPEIIAKQYFDYFQSQYQKIKG